VNTLKDLKNSQDKNEVHLEHSIEELEPKVDEIKGESLLDISPWEKSILNIGSKREIGVEKKKNTYKKSIKFDALEKSKPDVMSHIKSILNSSKDAIILSPKKNKNPTPYVLLLRRRIKSLWVYWIASVVIASLLILVWLGFLDKALVENRVNAGYQKLIDIKEWELSLWEIQKKVNNSRFDLLIADTFFSPFSLFPGSQINSVDHVIAWWRYLSKALDDMLALYTKTRWFIDEKSFSNIYFSQLFVNVSPELLSIETSLKSALYHYDAISWLPTPDLQSKRDANIKNITSLLWYLWALNKNYTTFLTMLGHEERKRYLIVFQNADEIRPTWGFMWSMWLLEIFRWKVQLFQKKDVYAIEWDLKSSDYERLPAPKWINELTDTFWLRDANYYVNLKDSSEAIKFFTDRAWIPIDGIVYINQNILLHLLELTGPVYFDELKRDITADNFSEIMSLVVEWKNFQEGTLWTPKQVLFDFIEVFWQKLQTDAKYFDYMQSLIHDTKSRDIMVYSFDNEARNFLAEMGLSWNIDYDSSLDFVYPVYTSLSWNKSDRYMKRKFIHKVTTGLDCSFDVEMTVENTHDIWKRKREYLEGLISEFEVESPDILQIQGVARNRQFVRMILPSKSQIIPQNDVAVVDYWSRKWVEYFTQTELTQTSYNTLNYVLENPTCKPYSYTFYKQPWINQYDMIIEVDGERFSYPNLEEDFYFEVR